MSGNSKWGNYLGLILGQLAIAGFKSYRRRRKGLLEDYRKLTRDALEIHSSDQLAYAQHLASLPALESKGNFNLVLDLSGADTHALDSFYLFLESENLKGSPVTALMSRAAEGQVRVEISQAFISNISGPVGAQLHQILEADACSATCLAKIAKRKHGYEVSLDVKLPPSVNKLH